jgi:Protein of unknown function (DUF2892)
VSAPWRERLRPHTPESFCRALSLFIQNGKEDCMSALLTVNEHPVERVARVGLGVALIVMAVMGTIGVWGYIGVVPLLTGALGSCPLYTLFGLSTCPVKTRA